MIEIIFALLLSGQATVIDGDTIDLAGQRVRLYGIDAPEVKQWCVDEDEQSYACGRDAKAALQWLVRGRVIECTPEGKDAYRRVLATCHVDLIDINQWMVQRGHALAYTRYSARYLADEDEAQSNGVGLWRGRFTPPWEWRRNGVQ